jgi:hypothetical protein
VCPGKNSPWPELYKEKYNVNITQVSFPVVSGSNNSIFTCHGHFDGFLLFFPFISYFSQLKLHLSSITVLFFAKGTSD